jgi:hypothetical protein
MLEKMQVGKNASWTTTQARRIMQVAKKCELQKNASWKKMQVGK